MADRIDVFHYQGFIPEEQRGGAYHVRLYLDGKFTGTLTPKEADEKGWPLQRILSEMNTQAMIEADNLRQTIAQIVRENARLVSLLAAHGPVEGEITFSDIGPGDNLEVSE